MGVLNGFQGKVNETQNKLRNRFSTAVDVTYDENDFPDGFLIQEILSNGHIGVSIRLYGNQLPKIPFTFGGSQRIKKDYYSGYSEPTLQVLGPEEDDITITGEFKDKRYQDPAFKNISSDIQQLIDGIRIRGNLVRIALGEFERYGVMSKTKFDLTRLSKVGYSIGFSIIGFNSPKNAIYLEKVREVPFAINKSLIAEASKFQKNHLNRPISVPRSIGDKINELTGAVAGAVAIVTGFVDQVISTTQDVQKSVTRARGLVRYASHKLNDYKKFVGSVSPFNESQALTGKYESAKFYAAGIAGAASLTALLARLRAQIENLSPSIPLSRHFVVNGDNLQKISIKFYGTADNWKKIYEYNKLSSTELITGTIIEIPRL